MKAAHAVILGLDGVPVKALELLFERGAMPYTRSLWQRMSVAETNVFLPLTAPSWLTISTGVNPGKHGVFDFFHIDPRSGEPHTVGKEMVERPLVNEIAAYMGLPSIALGVHYSYPPLVRRNTIVVSGWLSARLEAWPPEEAETAKRYGVSVEVPSPSNLEEYAENIVEGLERKRGLVEHYYVERSWRLFYLLLSEPDWLFHYLYGDFLEGGRRSRLVEKAFRVIDSIIRVIAENAPENTLLTVCSDHGFTVARKALNGNTLLEKLGLLVKRENRLPLRTRLILTAARLLPSGLKSRLKYSSAAFVARRLGAGDAFRMKSSAIDYAASKAFMTTSYNLYVNPRLSREERQKIRALVRRELEKYSHMLEVVAYGDEYFWGPYTGRAPDIVVIPREGYNVTTKLMYRSVVEKGRWYIHSNTGMLALAVLDGENQPKLPAGRMPTTADIAPTVLAHLGLPLDPVFDGEPLLEAVNPAGLGRRDYGILVRLGRGVRRLVEKKLNSPSK